LKLHVTEIRFTCTWPWRATIV